MKSWLILKSNSFQHVAPGQHTKWGFFHGAGTKLGVEGQILMQGGRAFGGKPTFHFSAQCTNDFHTPITLKNQFTLNQPQVKPQISAHP